MQGTAQERANLRALAVALRRGGATYDLVARDLGISKSTCSLWLRDVVVAPAASTPTTPGIADMSAARGLRRDGAALVDIAARLDRPICEVAAEVVDLPNPFARTAEQIRLHTDRQRDLYYAGLLATRERERASVKAAHASRVGQLTPRELELLAVVAYWSEGTKDKPYERRERVTFINSDPGLVLLFAAWLDASGVNRNDWSVCLSIHVTADVVAATEFWADVLSKPVTNFGPPWLKHHRVDTVRKNVGPAYVGCLVLRVRRSRLLYQRIAGVWEGICAGLPPGWQDGHAAMTATRSPSALV